MIIVAIFLVAAFLMATPVLAMGPDNAVGKNPNAISSTFGRNTLTEIWLPSGVMNEWITPGAGVTLPPAKAVQLDASKTQIPNAVEATNPMMIMSVPEHTWVHYSQAMFRIFLGVMHMNPAIADAYPNGIYTVMVQIGE